jgi:hypothetical protein
MKAGAVVSIRVNTTDLMSVIDMVNKAGAFFNGMSLSSAVSLGLSIATEELRRQGKLPVRDGFEYSAMIEPFTINKRNNRVKRAFAEAKYLNDAAGCIPALPAQTPAEFPESVLSAEELAMLAKQQEELDKRDGLVGSKETG